jgi:type II secretory pathway component GspD/PulD (secretin)
VLRRRLSIVLVLAVIAAGCAAGRAYRRGQEAARNGDWDAAVTYFTQAVQENPNRPEYKIALERANQSASQEHISRARQLEEKDQLDAALIEYQKALQTDSTNRLAASKVAELEKTIRDRIEAARPKPRIETLREQARAASRPLLDPSSRDPIKVSFNNASLRDILRTLGEMAGINVTFDQQFQDRAYTVTLDGVTFEQALQQVMTANQKFYKVVDPKTIIVVDDNPTKHAQYDDLVVKVFYVSHAEAQELTQLVSTIMRVPQMAVQPTVMANKTANTITVRATAPVVDIIERIIRSNDKPRAEVLIDVQILEVNRARAKQFGLNLNAYALGFTFSPEVAPPNTSSPPTGPPNSPPPFNVNTISQGVSTADFYMSVPTAVVRFLESDSHTKTIAKPQLRGAEGQKLTLNLGDDIPVLSTVFGQAAAGGFASIPQSSFNYRSVGVILEMTPRVTYDGEIILELLVENSTLGGSIDVAGQSVPTFGSRKVTTKLRLREGESNLLAGLLRERDRKDLRGFPGLLRLPVFKQFLSDNDQQIEQTDIVMLLTPHIVRTHELTADDLAPIYIGTQQNIGLTGAPQLIAPVPNEPAPAAGTAAPGAVPPSATTPGAPPPGLPRPPVAAEPGAQTPNRPAPPGTFPVPTIPTPPAEQPPATTPPAGGATGAPPPPGTQPAPTGAEPAGTPPGTIPPVRDPNTVPAAPAATDPAATATPAQVIITVPGTAFQIAGGPYTVPVSINNASRVSVMTLTVTFNPNVLRVRTVQDGTFMRQGGVGASFTPRIDAATGRVDIAITRTGDQVGASGAGLLAALLFDAVGPGSSMIQVTGVATTPEGAPLPLQVSPVTVTVR